MNKHWDSNTVKLVVTKHFALKYMRIWNWDFQDLRDAIANAYKIENVGKCKYEIYVDKSGFKKIVVVYEDEELICITGSQGGERVK